MGRAGAVRLAGGRLLGRRPRQRGEDPQPAPGACPHRSARRGPGRGGPVPPRLLRRRPHPRRPHRRPAGRRPPLRCRPARRTADRRPARRRGSDRRRPARRRPQTGPADRHRPDRRPGGRGPVAAGGADLGDHRAPGADPRTPGRRHRARHGRRLRIPALRGGRPVRLRHAHQPAARAHLLQPRRRTARRGQRGRRGARLRRRDRHPPAHPAGSHRPGLRRQVPRPRPGHRQLRRHRAPVGPGLRPLSAPAGDPRVRRLAGRPRRRGRPAGHR